MNPIVGSAFLALYRIRHFRWSFDAARGYGIARARPSVSRKKEIPSTYGFSAAATKNVDIIVLQNGFHCLLRDYAIRHILQGKSHLHWVEGLLVEGSSCRSY